MTVRSRAGAVLVAVLAVASLALVSAAPADADGVAAKVKTFEGYGYQPGPGGGLVLNWGFAPRMVSVPSGSLIKWTDASTDGEPHTMTVVKASNVPQTIDQIFNCAVCNQALSRHDPGSDQKPPFHKVVNVGKTGLNTEGDSRLLFPGESTFARVSAGAGSTLHYLCAIHPWMQAVIKVT